jgi:MFS family permease
MPAQRKLWGLNGYHWLVIAAAWLGWGFDVFDALLFNFVAPNCVPTLLGLPLGSPEAQRATAFWTGVLSSILLVGWAIGGVAFGWVADRLGRKRALLLTICLYAFGTAACAFATDMWQLVLFRMIASLGIGGEWAVGATLVAEVVPDERRVEAATIIYTASPIGIALASLANYQIAGVWLVHDPATSWRYVFLAGLAPVLVAVLVRLFIKESEPWKKSIQQAGPPKLRELFSPGIRSLTLSGFFAAAAALLTWWTCNAFIPLLGSTLADEHALQAGLTPDAARALAEAWKARAANSFNLGGLVGAFAAIPLAKRLGRRPMFIAYFLYSAITLFLTFGLDFSPEARIRMLFVVGAGVYGVFSAFVFYLPELFPARLRGMGAGFCYNIGRALAALGPFVIGSVSAASGGSGTVISALLFWLGVVPLITAVLARFLLVETRGRVIVNS